MTPEQNEMLTRVGPGTPGGEMLRRYWWPVGFAEEIQKKPVTVRHLGEDFVVFRDGAGNIGMLDRTCAHRRASLEFGRVEERGLRCCYHGWLYDAGGRCLEMPAEPPDSKLPGKVRQRAARVQVVAGLVFAYLGPEPAPTLPRYDLLFLDDCDRTIWAAEDHCNWVQRAENGVDAYHSMSLHASVYPSIALKRPEVEFVKTWYGFRTQSEYPGGNVNIVHDIFPSSTRRFNARAGSIPSEFLHIRVPVDDYSTMTFFVESRFKNDGPHKRECRGFQTTVRGVYKRVEDGWWGLSSDDQDRAAQESQGLIHDRTREVLGSSDRGIIMWRKLAFDSMKAVQEGRDPHGIVRGPETNDVIRFDAGKNFTDHDKAPVVVA
ncbi:MAG TPA: Rieske 2Fe-2S domain-containing protein [Candidatus Binatia bacterium]|nr:Rieske 2Fe-2S domain-containing protein [Candidatus Binatia bacterium]